MVLYIKRKVEVPTVSDEGVAETAKVAILGARAEVVFTPRPRNIVHVYPYAIVCCYHCVRINIYVLVYGESRMKYHLSTGVRDK
jgi:hypothetical protein